MVDVLVFVFTWRYKCFFYQYEYTFLLDKLGYIRMNQNNPLL